MAKKAKITNGERAMYAFFIVTLAGPFFAALMIAALALASGVAQGLVPGLGARPGTTDLATAGGWALQAYIWAALPAGLAGAMLAAWVSLRPQLPWVAAVTIAVVAFGIAAVLVPGLPPGHNLPLAFVAAIAGLGVWSVLARAGIIRPPA